MKTWKIRDIEIQNQVTIAPMAGISNGAFRSLVAHYKPGIIYTEMVSDKAIVHGNERTLKMCEVYEGEHPIALQLFGEDVESMTEAAIYLDTQTNCDIIDINMGCPVPKIVKGSGGASLMKDPDKAVAIVESIVKHVKKPVTVKTRLGWDSKSLNVVEFAKRLEKAGASAIAIHGRTRVQMYEGNADYELIKQVKEALSIPVIVNGDITSTQKAEEVLAYTKADALMIGRGVLGRPWFVKEVIEALDGKKIEEISFEERFEIALLHAQRLVELKGENLGIKEMRGQLGWYLKGLPNSHKVKDDLAKMNSLEDFDRIMKNYQNELENKD